MKHKLLTKEEEIALVRLYRAGNIKARNKLVLSNMGCVWKTALKYKGGSIPIQDLVSEGVFGLLHAAETFDISRGTKFVTHAMWCVQAYITNANRTQSTLIRIPANQQNKISKELKRIQNGDTMDSEVSKLLKISRYALSFDGQTHGNSSKETNLKLGDILEDKNVSNPEDEMYEHDLTNLTNNMLSVLTDNEKFVICSLFGLSGYTQTTIKDISKELNISKNQVKHYRDQSIRKIKSMIDDNILEESKMLMKN